jgi:hypothetical protein
MVRKLNSYYVLLAVLALTYVSIMLLIPPDPKTLERYHLTPLTSKLINLTIVIPFVVIWGIAMYGVVQLKKYTLHIIKSTDGKALHTVANGLLILALSLPVSGITSGMLNYTASQQDSMSLSIMTIIRNYLNLGLFIAAFLLIWNGAKALVAHLKQKPSNTIDIFASLTIVILGAVYSYLALTNPNKVVPSETTGRALYYLSDPAILLTIIIPYVLAWYIGLKSALYINYYREKVSGVLYKQFLKFLALGITFVVLASIATQFISAVSAGIVNLKLLPLLMLVYVLVAVIAVGYIFIAMGAKRLKKIEEV